MGDLAARLRQARETKGITLEQAEEVTHIRRSLLFALEEGRYQDLPGDVYGRGLVRNYARYLGLDPQLASQEFVELSGGRPEMVVPQMLSEPLAPPRAYGGWLLALGLLAVALVAGWYIYSTYISGGSPLPRLWFQPAPSPEATPPLETAEAEGPQETRTAEPTAEGEPEAVVEPTPEPTWTRIELPTPRPAQLPSPTPETGVLVQAFVEADTYVEVTLDGESAYIGILGPGETAEWRADEQVTLRVGNAGGIRLVVNGYDVGALGASGQVLTVEYSADSLPGR